MRIRINPPVLFFSAAFIAFAAATARAGDVVEIENSTLRVAFDARTATASVLDKRNNYLWRQDPAIPGDALHPRAVSVDSGADWIMARLDGDGLAALRLWLGPEEATLYARLETVDGHGYGPLKRYPLPFVMDPDEGYIVQCTNSDGMIFSFRELDQMRSPFNLDGGMPWYGVTDLTKGYICALDSFQHQGTGAYPMELRYHFTTEGGFVSLAKYYRYVADMNGKAVTLARKMANNPEIAKMAGAVVVYLWGRARSPEMIAQLREAGVDRAMTIMDMNHPPGPTGAFVDAATEAGYLCGPYDIFLAIMNPTTGWEKKEEVYSTDRRHWPEGWPEALIDYRPGVEPAERPTIETAYVCSTPLVDWAKSRIREEQRHFQYPIRFFDTLIPQVRACDSPLHPLNLEESRNARRELLRWTLEDMNQITGSGEGYSPDWAVPVTVWLEGAMSMRSYVTPYINNPASLPDGREDWTDGYAPAAVVKDMPPDDTLFELQCNPARRLPLYGLVYHDCVLTTWVWRNANHRFIGAQRHNDLMNILFGNMPLWSLTVESWQEKKDDLIAGYRDVSEWTRKIAFDEMTDYRWLSEDRKVAMSSFSSGWNVAVNMTDKDFEFEKGVVKAMGFLTWIEER